MARIFISYKRADKEKVFAIKDKIEAATGEKCWIDLDGIESDAQFERVIINAINQAEIFLFIYSQQHILINDVDNDWTIKEINFAQLKKKRIVFINIDKSPLTDWFMWKFGSKQQVDATSKDAFNHLLQDINKWLKVETVNINTSEKNGNINTSLNRNSIIAIGSFCLIILIICYILLFRGNRPIQNNDSVTTPLDTIEKTDSLPEIENTNITNEISTLTISKTHVFVNAESGITSISVESNRAWKLTNISSSFLSVSKNQEQIIIRYEANPNEIARTDFFCVETEDGLRQEEIYVMQKAAKRSSRKTATIYESNEKEIPLIDSNVIVMNSIKRCYEVIKIDYETSLSRLARKYYNNTYCWVYLYIANRKKIKNPNTVEVGIELIIPELTKEELKISKDESITLYAASQKENHKI